MSIQPLAHGVDTLVLWFSWGSDYRLPPDFHRRLEEARAKRLETDLDKPVFVDVGDLAMPRAAMDGRDYEKAQIRTVRHYRYGLLFGDNALFVAFSDPDNSRVKKDDYAQVRVELTGRYIRATGGDIRALVDAVIARLGALMVEAGLDDPAPKQVRITRLDLFADFASEQAPFAISDLERFTSRARDRAAWVEQTEAGGERGSAAPAEGAPLMSSTGGAKCAGLVAASDALSEAVVRLTGPRWTSFRFGSDQLLARIYSKTAEAKKKPSSRELVEEYRAAFDLPAEVHIWRVEFQLRKDVLAAFLVNGEVLDLRDWRVAKDHLADLWGYLTGSWLIHRQPSQAAQKTRWPVSALWARVMSAWLTTLPPVQRAKRPLRADTEGLLAQAVGVLASAAAREGLPVEMASKARSWLEKLLMRVFKASPAVLPENLAAGVFEYRFAERLALYQGVAA